jgi:hypothetical protein
MATSRWRAAVAAGMAGVIMAGCGAAPTASPKPTAAGVTPASGSPGAAVAGFLAAAGAQDNTRVQAWLATAADITNLTELLRVYSDFGDGRGLFWDVAGMRVTGVTIIDTGHADVELSGAVVWCVGRAIHDPAATCNLVTGVVAAMRHTYSAIAVGGRWRVDIDVDSSSGVDRSPLASPTGSAPTTPPT